MAVISPNPVVNSDGSVVGGVRITLDGSGSSDPDGENAALTYAWTQVANSAPTVTLTGANTVNPTFTTPPRERGEQNLSFTLVVTDEGGVFSVRSGVFVTVISTATNVAPTISGTPATTVAMGKPYSFMPTGADNGVDDILTYCIENQPSRAAFNTAAGALTGTPAQGDVGTTISSIVISVTDNVTPALSASLPAFEIEVTNSNDAPTEIALTSTTIAENADANTQVGILSATDADTGDTHIFELVTGSGDTDNGLFTIDGTSLKLTDAADFEAKPSYDIRVKATDSGQGTLGFEKAFTITVNDGNDAPVGLPTITGTVRQGETLTAVTSAISDADGLGTSGFSYQWKAGGTDINGATTSSFTLTQARSARPSP